MLTSRFFRNFASLSAVNAANMLLPLLTAPYVTRIIGPGAFGQLNFSNALVGYFALVINYGFELSASRQVAAVRDDADRVNAVFSATMLVKLVLFLVSTVVFALVIGQTPGLKAHQALHWSTYLITIGHVAYPTWFFQGMERLSRTAMINLLIKLLFTLLIFVLIQQPGDYWYQNLSFSIAHTLGGLTALVMAMREFNLKLVRVSWSAFIETLREGSATFYYNIVYTIYTGTNIIILQLTSSPASVGYYSAAYRVDLIVRSFILVAFGQSIFPIIARLFEKDKEQAIDRIRAILPIVSVLTILISVLLFSSSDIITDVLFGNKFKETATILKIIAALPVLVTLNYMLGIITMMNLNFRRQFLLITSACSAISIVINYFLSSRYHHVGTSIAWVSNELLIFLMISIFLQTRSIRVFSDFNEVRHSWVLAFYKLRLKLGRS